MGQPICGGRIRYFSSDYNRKTRKWDVTVRWDSPEGELIETYSFDEKAEADDCQVNYCPLKETACKSSSATPQMSTIGWLTRKFRSDFAARAVRRTGRPHQPKADRLNVLRSKTMCYCNLIHSLVKVVAGNRFCLDRSVPCDQLDYTRRLQYAAFGKATRHSSAA